MTQPALTSPRPGGRPRDESRDRAIRRATLQLLAEYGYDGVTMDRVATLARAGKATIYRRWRSKVDMVMDAVSTFTERTVQVPDSGSLRAEMIAFLVAFHGLIDGDQGRILAELVSEMPRNPELRAAVHDGMWSHCTTTSEAILARGAARGEIAPGVDPTVLLELGTALVLQRLLVTGEPVDRKYLEHIVDDVILTYARGPAAAPGGK